MIKFTEPGPRPVGARAGGPLRATTRGAARRLLATAFRGIAVCGALTFAVVAQETQDPAASVPQIHRPASVGSEERSAAPAAEARVERVAR